MTVTIPAELEKAVADFARERQRQPEDLVRDALRWYLQITPELWDELDAWQEVRDEALDVAEGGRP